MISSINSFAGLCKVFSEGLKEVTCDKVIEVNQSNADILSKTIYGEEGKISVVNYMYEGRSEDYFQGKEMRCTAIIIGKKTKISNVPVDVTNSGLCNSLE